MPVTQSTEEPCLRLSFRHVAERKAYVHLSGEARIRLCHKAGAPWAERAPDARLSKFQQETLRRRERHLIVHGGSRLGKSVLGGCFGVIEFMLPSSFTAFVAGRYEHVNDEFKYLAKGLKTLFGDQKHAFTRFVHRAQTNYYAFDVESIWGARAVGYSVDVDEGEVLLGKEFSRVICGEGSRINPEVGETRIKRAIDGRLMNNPLGQETGYLTIFTTPSGYDGLSSFEWDRVDKRTKGKLEKAHYGRAPFAESYWLLEASVLNNPAYDRKVYEARKREAEESGDTAAFDEQYRGLRTYATGRVYREFKDSRARVPLPDPDLIRTMRLGVGIDTGACFGAVLVGLDRSRNLWWLGDVYTEKRHVRDSCADTRRMIETILGPVFDTADYSVLCDAIDIWVIDPASQSKLEVSEYLGDVPFQHPARGKGKFELLPTIDAIREVMHEDRFFLVDTCTSTWDQIRKYTWKRTRTGDKNKLLVVREPNKGNDHCLDAGRLVSVPMMELGPREEPAVVVPWNQAHQESMRASVWGPLNKMLRDARERGPMSC